MPVLGPIWGERGRQVAPTPSCLAQSIREGLRAAGRSRELVTGSEKVSPVLHREGPSPPKDPSVALRALPAPGAFATLSSTPAMDGSRAEL